jgi:hypothetical protein
MKKLKKTDYIIINGKKFFYTSPNMSFQCAYCLYLQQQTFVRNKDGLIIGVDVLKENESHSRDCKQLIN